jgi:alpha-beta hydrolase superfamily lysophospholipase
MRALATVAATLLAAATVEAGGGLASRTEACSIRGVPQTLHLYGTRGGPAAVVTSGDGGWVHLGPAVAEFLATQGYFVVGFDAKAYLASFTSNSGPLHVEDVPHDYATLVEYAARGGRGRPLLVGVSEGAGLSVLAATAPDLQSRVAGVVALGLPDKIELGWRWRDSIIYVTKKTPDEPTFSARDVVGRVAPVPLAALHSTHDEFVALPEIQGILAQAREPKRLWVIEAANHRFSDSQPDLQRRLQEAIAWIESERSKAP